MRDYCRSGQWPAPKRVVRRKWADGNERESDAEELGPDLSHPNGRAWDAYRYDSDAFESYKVVVRKPSSTAARTGAPPVTGTGYVFPLDRVRRMRQAVGDPHDAVSRAIFAALPVVALWEVVGGYVEAAPPRVAFVEPHTLAIGWAVSPATD